MKNGLIEVYDITRGLFGSFNDDGLICYLVGRRWCSMRRTRSDCTVGTFEKKHGLPPGTIRNKDGRDTRSDKKIGTIRKEFDK